MEDTAVVDEIEAAIKSAAGGSEVVMIRLAVGKEVSFSRVELAKEMHRRFPKASLELETGKETDSVVVKDIEVD